LLLVLSCFRELTHVLSSGCYAIDGVDEKAQFARLVEAMTTVGITAQEQAQIFGVLAAILHLGNLRFSKDDKVTHCRVPMFAVLLAPIRFHLRR
jgi:myosin heavy subunit